MVLIARQFARWVALFMLLAIAGCGGGGGGSAPVAVAAPTITGQPISTTVSELASVHLTVTATGQALSYQWRSSIDGGVTWTDIVGANASSYSTPMALVDSGKHFQVYVSNSLGNVTSNDAVILVNPLPTIDTQPINTSVRVGSSAVFSAAASGTPAPTYLWQQSIDGGASFQDVTAASLTGSTIVVNSTTLNNNGLKLRVKVTNTVGTVISNVVTLTVTP